MINKQIKISFINFILFFFQFLVYSKSIAQCTPSSASSGTCSGGNGAVSNNANINGGDNYWFNGGPTTYSNINVSGGTLRVCGNLTITSLTFNSGDIIIENGGSLTCVNSVTMNSNTKISNYGTLTFNNNVLLQNSNNFLINATSASTMTIMGTLTIQNNASASKFINNGTANINNLTIQPNNGGVCLGTNSAMNINNITISGANSITAFTNGCIRFTGNANLSVSLTNDTDVVICRATGATTSGSGSFGSATVYNNCSACSSSLPIELAYFRSTLHDNFISLEWATLSEFNSAYFIVQKSKNGIDFQTISEYIAAKKHSQSLQTYYWKDNQPFRGINYYRLIQVDKDQTSHIFPLIAETFNYPESYFYSDNQQNFIKIQHISKETLLKVYLYQSSGNLLWSKEIELHNMIDGDNIHLPILSQGIYICKLIFNNRIQILKFIKI